MNNYTTLIKAIDPQTGELHDWIGPVVPGYSFEDAEMYCQANWLGYCKVEALYTGEQQYLAKYHNN